MFTKNIIEQFKTSREDKILEVGNREFKRFLIDKAHDISIDYTKKENLSAELLTVKMRYSGPAEGTDELSRIAGLICERITYLSENFKLIELDRHNNKVQIRSAPPYHRESLIYYFEIILDLNRMSLQLQRLAYDSEDRSLEPVPFVISYDLLERLMRDLFDLAEL